MKKILFSLVFLFSICVNASAQENRYGLTTAEVEFLKTAMEKNSVPYIGYVASWYVYSAEMGDYVKLDHRPTNEDIQYYKSLNKVYSRYSRNKKFYDTPNDFFYNEQAYFNAKSHKCKNELIAGVTFTALGITSIVGTDLYIINRDWTKYKGDNLTKHISNLETISRAVGGALAITGSILTIDAINKQHHLLKVSTNNLSYTYRF